MPVFEQGYKHWDGELSGHAWRWWTIARQGVRIALQGWGLRMLTMMAMTPSQGWLTVMKPSTLTRVPSSIKGAEIAIPENEPTASASEVSIVTREPRFGLPSASAAVSFTWLA